MSSKNYSRRNFLKAAGLAAGAATLANVPLALTGIRAASAASYSVLQNFVNLRFGMMMHFNMGTFTDEEWATPNLNPTTFAPTAVNCEQWADAAVAAGMKFGILTTKHHDGFCLWPTAQTAYNVMNSSYQQDIVQQYVDAFRSRGLKIGLYYSIWDRSYTVQSYTRSGLPGVGYNDAINPADQTFVLNQIQELLTNYGTIDIFITDGWAWAMGQQEISYQVVRDKVKTLQPNIVMIDHGALSEPFLGDAIYFEEPKGITAPAGNTYAACQGQTISSGWFWHPYTPTTEPMSLASIVQHLNDLEPRYTNFIINCAPNRNGVIDPIVVNRLAQVGSAWSPNLSRPALPTQPVTIEYPVSPVNAYATYSYSPAEGPLKAIDGTSDDYWQTAWSTWNGTLPHSITIDLGGVWSNVSTLHYLPKQWYRTGGDGDITSYKVFVSTNGVNFTQVATGSWAANQKMKIAQWPPQNVGFVRLTVNAADGGFAYVTALRIGGAASKPVLVSRFPVIGTTYRIEARHSGKVLDVSGVSTADGAHIIQWTYGGGANQKFKFEDAGNGYFKIRNVNSGKLIDDDGASRENGAHMLQWSDQSSPNQHWAVTPIGVSGYYCIVNRLSGKALDVAGGSTADGAHILQWDYNNNTNQHWRIIAS